MNPRRPPERPGSRTHLRLIGLWVALLALSGAGWPASGVALANEVDPAASGRTLDVALVPIVGGDTDIGLGAGASGAKGVRGIPKNRYYGKRKAFGNIEARGRLVTFRVRDSDYQLGLAGFFDGGRVWADLSSAPELDGRGLGLKYGAGGRIRLQKGTTFVLRIDLAWSPDARPLGGYFLAGHIF